MAPKKDKEKEDQLHDSVIALTATVEKLQTRLDNLLPDDMKDLKVAVDALSLKIDGMNIDSRLTELNDSITTMKDTVIKNLLENNTKLNVRVNVMETKITNLEKMVYLNNQRSRENNIELIGIDDSISDNNLQGVVEGIMNKMKIECFDWDIQGCHRLPLRKGSSSKPTIVKFVNRKKPELIMKCKKALKELDFTDLGLPTDSSIFANINLSPPFKELDYFCRMLKKDGLISNLDTTPTYIKIKVNGEFIRINHVNDLKTVFTQREFVSRLNVPLMVRNVTT